MPCGAELLPGTHTYLLQNERKKYIQTVQRVQNHTKNEFSSGFHSLGTKNPDTSTAGQCLFSYFLSVDRFADRSSTLDNKQEVNDIEDDEHKCDQSRHKCYLKIHTKQVGNKSPKENHKYQCHYHHSYENNHMNHSSNIDHIEISHSIFENSLELSTN
jgi:hypothetical protein